MQDQGARPNRFTVDFYCPKLNIALEGVRCVNASLPGRQIEAGDFSTYGPLQKMPFNLGMDGQEVSFQFICDSSFADRLVIATASSNIHAKSVSYKLVESLKKNDIKIIGVEGQSDSGWILVDCGDLVINIMKKDIREFYDLESLWGTSSN